MKIELAYKHITLLKSILLEKQREHELWIKSAIIDTDTTINEIDRVREIKSNIIEILLNIERYH